MSIANFIPDLWTARLLANLDKNQVLTQLANRDYEGDVRAFGDSVKINRPGNIAAGAYTKGGTLTYAYPASNTRTLAIDQRVAAAFKLDDLDKIQANVNLVDSYMQRASYSMADDKDRFIAGLYTAAGAGDVTLDISGSISAGLVFNAFVTAGLYLDANNVPTQGRWAAISPALHAAMLKDTRIIQATDRGDAIVGAGNGIVGNIAGFTLVKTNNLLGTGVTVKLNGAVAVGAEALTVDALSAAVPAGTILVFGPGKYVRVTATADASATSVTVAAVDVALADNAEATYVSVRKCIFGTNAAITFAEQMRPSIEALRDKDTFDDYLRAEQVYGGLVVEPYALGTLSVTEV
jgi:hypothetical protein